MTKGFRIGFRYVSCSCTQVKSNMKSVVHNITVVEGYLTKEVEWGRVIGPHERDALPTAHVSRFNVIPKNHHPGEWRLIVDLSHPAGVSVNDRIESELCTVKYTSVDEALRVICMLGPGTLMESLCVESAYRIIPVQPTDRLLLGMVWKVKLYIDSALTFGLRLAPKIFNSVAEAFQWILASRGAKAVYIKRPGNIYNKPL